MIDTRRPRIAMLAGLIGEFVGTFLMVLFGTGAVACAVLTGALAGLGEVAFVWAIGVTLVPAGSHSDTPASNAIVKRNSSFYGPGCMTQRLVVSSNETRPEGPTTHHRH